MADVPAYMRQYTGLHNDPYAPRSDLDQLYGLLEPDPNAEYGTMPWMPFAKDRTTGDVRLAMPSSVREGLLGVLDLLKGTETGSLTGRALETITAGSMGTGGLLAPRGSLAAGAARLRKPEVFPELAERYPEVAPPVLATDPKTGKQYLAKQWSDEATDFAKSRELVRADMEQSGYKPYFDPAKRTDVDPTKYPAMENTAETILMKKPETRAKYDELAQDPKALDYLERMYLRGMQQKEAAGNWYYMGQLEKEFIKEYGAQEGRQKFKERFADAMAATTGGADPTSNFLMAHYGNYLKNKGLDVPGAAYEMPYPIGGRYASGNMAQYAKMLMEGGEGITTANPKRYNFSGNFTGSTGATMDEQMMSAWGKNVPEPGAYGHYEAALANLANKHGVDPRFFQEVAWAGIKDASTKGGYTAKPMISHINDSIERTSRLTGLSPQEVVRQGLVRAEMPMYSKFIPAPVAVPSRQELQARGLLEPTEY